MQVTHPASDALQRSGGLRLPLLRGPGVRQLSLEAGHVVLQVRACLIGLAQSSLHLSSAQSRFSDEAR